MLCDQSCECRYASFAVSSPSEDLKACGAQNVRVAVWTTTPWTMPANLAVAVNERLDYSVVKAPDGNRCVNTTHIEANWTLADDS